MSTKGRKKFTKGATRVANALDGALAKLQSNFKKLMAWELSESADALEKAAKGTAEVIDSLRQLAAEGWNPPKKKASKLAVVKGDLLSISPEHHVTYAELYGVTKSELSEMQVIAVREGVKHGSIVVKTKNDKQFPVARQHIDESWSADD